MLVNKDKTLIKISRLLNEKLKSYTSILNLPKETAQNQAIENWLREHQQEVNEKAKELL